MEKQRLRILFRSFIMKNKSRLKLFLENFLFYGGLTMLTKAFPLIMLPIVTRLLPDASSYGIADMFTVVSNFGTQIAVLGMYDAMFREFFEDKKNIEYQKKVTSTALVIVFISGTAVFAIFTGLSRFFSKLFFSSAEYSSLIILSGILILFSGMRLIIQAPTRMRNQKKVFFWTGIGGPVVSYGFIILFIKLGYTYEALIYSTVSGVIIFLIVFLILNYNDFSFKCFDKKIAKELFKIGIPLLPAFLIYWIFSSMDRIMIGKILGISELGIYSVGSRIAAVSQLIYTAFAGGWQFFAFSTMNDKDQIDLNSKVFEYLGVISFSVFIISLPFIKPVFNILFVGDYRRGMEVFPYLFLSPLLLMLFQTIGNQVIVVKKTYLSTLALSLGGVVNIILNYVFIKEFGIKGAALSTLISYFISVGIMILICKRHNLENINQKFYISTILTFIIVYIKFMELGNIVYIFGITSIFIMILMYLKDIKFFLKLKYINCDTKVEEEKL
jgi:O-antigen/teichoic acid export membrane protein